MNCLRILLEYLPIPMASRPITPSTPARTVVAGTFQQGPDYTNWRPEGSGDWVLIYTADGRGVIAADGHPHYTRPGSVVLYEPGAAQDYGTAAEPGTWELLWAHFQPQPNWRAWSRWAEWAPGVRHREIESAEITQAIESALKRMIRLNREDWPGSTELTMNALEEALLWIETAGSGDVRWRVDARVRRAMDFLAQEVGQSFDLAKVARHAGLSVSRLCHLFKVETGVTLQRYSEELKLRGAQQLLAHTSLRIHEVATETGFQDPYYFSKRFRTFSGMPPKAWREQQTRR